MPVWCVTEAGRGSRGLGLALTPVRCQRLEFLFCQFFSSLLFVLWGLCCAELILVISGFGVKVPSCFGVFPAGVWSCSLGERSVRISEITKQLRCFLPLLSPGVRSSSPAETQHCHCPFPDVLKLVRSG